MMLFVFAALELLAPINGAEVALLPECQRAVLSKETREERTEELSQWEKVELWKKDCQWKKDGQSKKVEQWKKDCQWEKDGQSKKVELWKKDCQREKDGQSKKVEQWKKDCQREKDGLSEKDCQREKDGQWKKDCQWEKDGQSKKDGQSEKDKQREKEKKAQKWRCSNPFAVSWAATAGEKGCWEVQLAKNADFSDARIFDFSKQSAQGRTAFTNELAFANLEIATTYHWKVICHGATGDVESAVATFKTEDLAPRWIAIEGRVGNFRDLGGRFGFGGRRVRQGMIYRSQGLNDNSASDGRRTGRNRLTVEDVAYLTGSLGIKTDLDLRSEGETAKMTASPLGPTVKYINHSSRAYKDIFSESGKKVMAENFRVFLDRANYPIDFHCIAGADRTGALGYVLNGVLGVSRRELETDWESTFYPVIPYKNDKGELSWNSEQHFNDGFGSFGEADATWNERVILYLKSCGITDAEIETFRSIMLEP